MVINIDILLEIRDKIRDAKTYYNFCTAFNLNFNNKNKINFDTNFEKTFYPNNFSLIFFYEFQNNLNWDYISLNPNLNIIFLKKFQNKINWDLFTENQQLDNDIINEFKNLLNWKIISKDHDLSENFILENICYLDLSSVLKYQYLSTELKFFLIAFKKKLILK